MANHDIKVIISADGAQAVREADKVKGALHSVSNVNVSNGSMNALAHQARNADNEVKRLHNSVGSLPGTLARVGAAISAAFTVGAIFSVGKAALQASANMELLKKGLSFTLGNSEAKRLIKTIQGIGEASAYDTTQLMPMARAWVNLGDNVDMAAKKIQRIVDLGSAYGLTADEIGRANTALAQMQMAGKIGAQDMMQLTNANIPAWKLLSEKMGLSVAQLKEMSSQGQLTQEAMDMLFEAMAENAGGAAKDLADTLTGKFSNIEEAVTNSMATIGDIIVKTFDIKGVLDRLGALAQGFKGHMEDIKADIENGTQPLWALKNKLDEVAPGVVYVAGAFVAFKSVQGVISGVEAAIGLVNLALKYQPVLLAAVQTAYGLATVAARVFSGAWKADPFLWTAAAIIGAIMLILANWNDVVEGFKKRSCVA
ncbi:MAG: tape measure protein [Dialister sp.]|nr:tape measure protein [Dialister sp.]